uniref:G_PROTEIN_RECEP_F1_2 domain-containing protein n=1 Tax=Heterorhabditis bacteriophora TaxID=37862 RepID=A0A1I7WQ70_HETBA
MDRYRSIVTPLKEPWNLKHAQMLLIVTWLVAMFASSPLYFSQSLKTLTMENITLCGEFCGEFNWSTGDHTKVIYGICLLVIQFMIPAVIMSICYWKILQKFYSHEYLYHFRTIFLPSDVDPSSALLFTNLLYEYLIMIYSALSKYMECVRTMKGTATVDTNLKLAISDRQNLSDILLYLGAYYTLKQQRLIQSVVVRTDWIVEEGSMLTAAQQAQTAVRKRRVMYVLILMVVVFMGSWLPLSAVNLIKDLGIPLMYFKLLNVHAIAMTSVVWNPLLYFWMSKRHRRALKDDMTWLTNARRHTNVGVLSRFAPSPSVSVVYRRTLERHLGVTNFRRGTLADPTCMARERAQADLHSNCFLLVPLMPLCQSGSVTEERVLNGSLRVCNPPHISCVLNDADNGTMTVGVESIACLDPGVLWYEVVRDTIGCMVVILLFICVTLFLLALTVFRRSQKIDIRARERKTQKEYARNIRKHLHSTSSDTINITVI